MAACVSQKERERHHREPPVVQEKGYSALRVSDALNSCGHPFLSGTSGHHPIWKKNRESQVNVLSSQLFSPSTAVTGSEQLTYMKAVCGRTVNLQTFLKGALILQGKEFAESPTSTSTPPAATFTFNLN